MEKEPIEPSRTDGPAATPRDLYEKPFRFYMRNDPRTFALGVMSLFFTNLFDVLTPLSLKFAIDQIKDKNLDTLKLSIAAYCGLMAACTVFRYLWRIYFGRFHHSVAEDLRNRIYGKLTSLGPSFYQKNPVGELMSLLTNDVNSFRMAIGPGVLILLDAVFLIVMILPVMFYLSVDWTLMSLAILPLVPFFIRHIERLIHVRYRAQQDRLAEVSASAQEIISGIRVIKSYAQEDHQRAAFNRFSRDYENACNKVARVDSAFQPVMEFGVASGSVILLYFCTPEVMRGAVTLGTFVAFHEYIKKMVWPMSAIGMGVSMLEQGRASFGRIGDMLKTETDIPDTGQARLERFEKLEIRDLTFQYPSGHQPVLKNVSLEIRNGETIGIVGPVGAGKTTLMQLICRLYPVANGKIRVNGLSLEEISQACLREMISFVPQDAFLFSDTISENVALGIETHPGLEPVQRMARVVNIEKEIGELPDGFESQLGERGVNLSGGQKQRLTIARALIRRSPVVILDDSLSAVDGNTEREIVRQLKSVLESRHDHRQTTILVSHRLATLKHADRIVVLNQGMIEAVGTHEELLSASATYRNLETLQSEQKLALDGAAVVITPPTGALAEKA